MVAPIQVIDLAGVVGPPVVGMAHRDCHGPHPWHAELCSHCSGPSGLLWAVEDLVVVVVGEAEEEALHLPEHM